MNNKTRKLDESTIKMHMKSIGMNKKPLSDVRGCVLCVVCVLCWVCHICVLGVSWSVYGCAYVSVCVRARDARWVRSVVCVCVVVCVCCVIHMYVCMYASIYVCMYVCMIMYVCVYVCYACQGHGEPFLIWILRFYFSVLHSFSLKLI